MRKLNNREVIMLDMIIWLYNKLQDYIVGSGSTPEDDKEMIKAKELITRLKELA